VTVSAAKDDKFFLAFMRDEVATELVSMCVDEETKLGKDCNPDVVRAEDKATMVVVSLEHGMHEPVRLWHDVPYLVEFRGEGSAEEVDTTLELFRGSLLEDCEVGVLAERDLKAVVLWKRLGGMTGGAK